MKPKRIDLGDGSSGIAIEFVARWHTLRIHIGEDRFDLPLGEFLERLGITDATIARVRRERREQALDWSHEA